MFPHKTSSVFDFLDSYLGHPNAKPPFSPPDLILPHIHPIIKPLGLLFQLCMFRQVNLSRPHVITYDKKK